MEKEIIEFKTKFNQIRNMGYVKSINNNNSGIGLTFEKLLGKKEDNFPFPDFQNTIEIKTKLAYSKRPVHLFKLTPEGNDFIESRRILNKYGYFQVNNKMFKVFNGTIYAYKRIKIGPLYYFSLEVNYKEEKVKLLIFNKDNKLIDNSSYWTFSKIENALYRKIKYLVLVSAWSTKKDKTYFYKYYRYDIYKNSNIFNFLYLLEKGFISITFSIDTYMTKERFGQMHDHGVSFDINKNDLDKLFFQLY